MAKHPGGGPMRGPVRKPKDAKKTLFRIFSYVGHQKWLLCLVVIFIFISFYISIHISYKPIHPRNIIS